MKKYTIFFILVVLFCSSCRTICPYHRSFTQISNNEWLKQYVDSAEIKYYNDIKFNVNIFYPSSFHIVDTSKAGMAYFANSITNYKVSLRLIADSNNSNIDVEKAVAMDMSDTTMICLDKGNDFYLVKGNSFYKKCYLIDNNWIRYILSYSKDYEGAIDRLVGLIKEWDPRIKPYENDKNSKTLDIERVRDTSATLDE